jgi:methyl-accepting chemotaxis protein
MKTNLPVTNKERPFPDGAVIVTKTDAKGIITFVNPDFVEISGFTEKELVGSNHNIVRHPDMPPAAFEDLWDTVKAGRPWSGIVKNRCKSGDHYWVQANVAAEYENGRLTGYVSVRHKPTREQIEAASTLYREINEGRAKVKVMQGYVVKPGILTALKDRVRDMSLRAKLISLAMPLLLAVLYFSASGFIGKLELAADMGKMETLTTLSVKTGSLAHEVQKERGMSAGYLGSKGAKFAAELPEQRKTVDAQLSAVKKALGNFDSRGYPDSLRSVLDMAISEIGKIPDHRSQVDAMTLTVSDGITRYTAVIDSLLRIPMHIAALSNAGGEVARLSSAYAYLLEFKERDGRERAILNGVFSNNRFTPTLLRRFLANAAEEDTYREMLLVYLPENQRAFFDKKMAEPAAVETLKIVKFAEESYESPKLGVDPNRWFGLSTQRINLERDVEVKLAEDLEATISHLRSQAYVAAVSFLLASIVPILIVALFGLHMIRAIAGSMKNILAIFDRITQGHYLNDINTQANDDFGKVMQALKTMQTKLGFDINETRRIADESRRIKNALDNTSTNVMVANTKGAIIYANRALVGMFKKTEDELRQALPGFSAENLLGMGMDMFFPGDAQLREQLKVATTTIRATLKHGACTFQLVANPVINEAGERLGICIEWLDITAELSVQEEINALVNAAAAGDLTKRVALEDKQGFMKKLGEGMNELLEVLAASMDDVSASLDAMAKGDLTVAITKDYQGTFGKLKEDINATVGKLTEVVTNIKESADMIKTASSEISMGNANLSQRTQEQASALEETASSMEQMSGTVKQNADNARQANQMVNSARDQAQSSGEIVTNAVGAMDAIASSSKKISDIISVIDEIAFQTNLLALNAAVEAARAGEQGRGFAVVATEVRNLAQRSATAAKEIKGLINDSVENVENGTKQVDASGEVLAEISGSVKKISDIVGEIAAASHEQASGIEQVNKAVMQMDEMTQQNAALVEQAAAASKSMEEQAVQLFEQVTFFKLYESEKAVQNQPQKMTKVSVVPASAKAAMQPSKKAAPVLKTVTSRPSVAKVKGGSNDVEWDEF